jgi:hypothetical protein
MANIALVTANRVRNAEPDVAITRTGPAAEAITAGAPCRLDTTTGKITNANGTDAAEARGYGIALHTVAAGEAVTVMRFGYMDGFDLAALDYDAAVYMSDTDGRLGAVGDSTVDVIIGRVVPAWATTLGTAADKLLEVNFLKV